MQKAAVKLTYCFKFNEETRLNLGQRKGNLIFEEIINEELQYHYTDDKSWQSHVQSIKSNITADHINSTIFQNFSTELKRLPYINGDVPDCLANNKLDLSPSYLSIKWETLFTDAAKEIAIYYQSIPFVLIDSLGNNTLLCTHLNNLAPLLSKEEVPTFQIDLSPVLTLSGYREIDNDFIKDLH